MRKQGKSILLEEAASAQDQRKDNPGAFEKQKGQRRERETNKRGPSSHRTGGGGHPASEGKLPRRERVVG